MDLYAPRNFQDTFEIDFNEIKLDKQISEGAFGVVFRARFRETICAVKMLKTVQLNEFQRRDFISECKAMEALRHPNICMFMGACTKSNNLALVLEFCSKGSLWAVIQNLEISISWDERKRLAIETGWILDCWTGNYFYWIIISKGRSLSSFFQSSYTAQRLKKFKSFVGRLLPN